MKDRHLRILNLVNARDHISVRELADMLNVSVVTMRKDLDSSTNGAERWLGMVPAMQKMTSPLSNDGMPISGASWRPKNWPALSFAHCIMGC